MMKTLLIALVSVLSLTACTDDPTGITLTEEHCEVVSNDSGKIVLECQIPDGSGGS